LNSPVHGLKRRDENFRHFLEECRRLGGNGGDGCRAAIAKIKLALPHFLFHPAFPSSE